MAIRSFGKADRGVQVSRWDPLPQGSPGEQSADNRQGDGSIPSAATKFYSGQVELAHHDGLISRSRSLSEIDSLWRSRRGAERNIFVWKCSESGTLVV